MSVVESVEPSYHNKADKMSSNFPNDYFIDPTYDGVVMLSHDLHLFGDAEVRPDGKKIFHIFERAPLEDEIYDDSNIKMPEADKEALWLKSCESSFKNIQEIMLKNGILLDEWCPPLSESRRNSRSNTAVTAKRRQRVPSTLPKNFKKQAGENVNKRKKYPGSVEKVRLSSILKNKKGKENGDSIATEGGKSSKIVSFSTDSKRRMNKPPNIKEEEKFDCPNCSFSSLYKRNLKAHVFRHCPNRDKAEVSYDSNSFKNPEILPAKDRLYLCDMCNYSTRTKVDMKSHKLTHLKDKKFTCPFCGFGSNVLNRIQNHIYRKHKDLDEKKSPRTERLYNRSKTKTNEPEIKKELFPDYLAIKSSPAADVSSLNLGNINMNCNVLLNKCVDMQGEETNENVAASEFDCNTTVIKKEIDMDLEYNDSLSSEISIENPYQNLKIEALDDIKEVNSSLDFVIKGGSREDLGHEDDDDDSLSTLSTENQEQDLKSELVDDDDDDQESQSPFDLLGMETTKNLSFYQNIKQETVSPDIFSNISVSPIENSKNSKIKLEILSDDDEELKVSHYRPKRRVLNRSTKDFKSAKSFGVIENTNNKTILFKSAHCPYTSTFKYKIIQHYQTHLKDKTFNCLDCNFTAKCLFLLKLHKKTHIENHYECKLCSFSTTSGTTLKSHIFIKHRTKRNKNFYKTRKLRKRTIKSEATFNCNMCTFKSSDEEEYQKHLKTHVSSRSKLSRVKKRPSRNSSRIKESRRISDDVRMKSKSNNDEVKQNCETKISKIRKIVKKELPSNESSFITYDDNIGKIENHIKPSENNKSSKENPSKDELGKSESNLSQTTLSCDSCQFTTFLKIDLLKHKQSHLSPLKNGIFKCTECSFSASKNKVLISHLMNHAYKCLYRCIFCNFSANNKAKLKSHKYFHKKPREKTVSLQAKNVQTYKCFKCDYSCTSQHLLNQHAVIHFENKILKCAHCDYETNFRGNLVKHVLIHVDEYIE